MASESGEVKPSRARAGPGALGGCQGSAPDWQGDLEPIVPPLWASVSPMCNTRDYFISKIPSFQLLKL